LYINIVCIRNNGYYNVDKKVWISLPQFPQYPSAYK
jgi:hypothetical protein